MKSNDWTLALLKHVFHNVPQLPLTDSLYISLHTADPGRSGSQTTSEATYQGYSRVPVSRISSRWEIVLLDKDVGPVRVTNMTLIAFPEATGGSNTITYAAVGTLAKGAGSLLYSGKMIQPLMISAGIIPEFRIGDLLLTES